MSILFILTHANPGAIHATTPRQSIIANFGRADRTRCLRRVGFITTLGAKLTDQALLINALDVDEDADGVLSAVGKRIGGPLLFGNISNGSGSRTPLTIS